MSIRSDFVKQALEIAGISKPYGLYTSLLKKEYRVKIMGVKLSDCDRQFAEEDGVRVVDNPPDSRGFNQATTFYFPMTDDVRRLAVAEKAANKVRMRIGKGS